MKLFAPALLLLLVVAATFVTDKPLPPADFTFINRGDVTTLDPQRMSWMQDLRVGRLVFEGLVANDVFTDGYDIVPAVAERWEISPDGLLYTFHLRPDARWTNGAPVTAHDFVYSWRRALLPDTASDYSGLFQLIRGAGAFYAWREAALNEHAEAARALSADQREAEARALWQRTLDAFDDLVGVEALDERTLRVELERPTPYFLDLCAFAVFYPVYEPVVSQYETVQPADGRIKLESGWTKPDKLVSNGPYQLKVWRFKRDMYFVQNPHYWNRQALDVQTMKCPSVEDPNAAVLAFRTGTVDWVSDVTPAYRADMLADKLQFYEENRAEYDRLRAMGLDQFEIDRRLPDDPRKNIHAVSAFGTYWYNFNCLPALPDGRPNPFHDATVRRAFAMAIDKQTIVREVRRTGEQVATTIIPPGSIGGYDSPAGVPFDPVAAARLLDDAGYADRSTLPTIELLFNKDAGHDLIAQSIAKDWERYLGVETRLVQKEIKVYKDDLKKQNYMTGRAGWYGDYGDPTTFLDVNRRDDGNNDRKYDNPAYDALLDQAAAQTDPDARMALLEEAERIIMDEDLPMVPIFHYVTMYLFDPDELSGINPHPRTTQNLYLVDILGDGKGRDRPRMMRDRPEDPFTAREPRR
ncbi:MAG: peptide ABC transporter substrate-binding protein [Phycisphaerales bacterium JB039]